MASGNISQPNPLQVTRPTQIESRDSAIRQMRAGGEQVTGISQAEQLHRHVSSGVLGCPILSAWNRTMTESVAHPNAATCRRSISSTSSRPSVSRTASKDLLRSSSAAPIRVRRDVHPLLYQCCSPGSDAGGMGPR